MRCSIPILLLVMAVAPVRAATILVPGNQPTIQAGIDAASAGDTVLVGPGTFSENIIIPGVDLVLLGDGAVGSGVTVLQPLTTAEPIVLFEPGSSPACEVNGFSISNSGASSAMVITGGPPTISNNVHHNLFVHDGGFSSLDCNGPSHIYNNTVYGAYRYGIRADHDGAVAVNNIAIYCGQNGITGIAGARVDYNIYFLNSVNALNGPNDMAVDPGFVDSAFGDFHLDWLSPALDAGDPNPGYNEPDGSRSDIGAFPYAWLAPRAIGLTIEEASLTPLFAWSYVDTAATTQQAFEIEVGSDDDWLIAEFWNSGTMSSPATAVVYGGAPLHDRGFYYCRVRVHNGTQWGTWTESRFAVATGPPRRIAVPGDLPTIQEAIDASLDGDTIDVAAGTYSGEGNVDLDTRGKGVLLRSVDGLYQAVIDCQGTDSRPRHGFHLHSGEDNTTIIDGLVIRNAYMRTDRYRDGAAMYLRAAAPEIRRCRIYSNAQSGIYSDDNWAVEIIDPLVVDSCDVSGNGGLAGLRARGIDLMVTRSQFNGNGGYGLWNYSMNPTTIDHCLFFANGYDGAVVIFNMSDFGLNLTNCTFANNEGSGFVYSWDFPKSEDPPVDRQGSSVVSYNIAVFNEGSGMQFGEPWSHEIHCNNAFGNTGDDFQFYGAFDTLGNMSLDPLFCDTTFIDFHIAGASPCAPANNACGVLIGAFDIGCECCMLRGNIDGATVPAASVNVSDITFLVAYLFAGGDRPRCIQ